MPLHHLHLRRLRRLGVATAALAALTLAGCSTSDAPSTSPIAHAGEPATTSTSAAPVDPSGAEAGDGQTPPGSASKFEAYLASERAFAKCMRGHGYDFPDPDADGIMGGNFKRAASQLSPAKQETAFATYDRCRTDVQLLPDPRPQSYPSLTDDELAHDQELARCFRAHGVPGYPDPVRETDPSLPAVKRYESALHELPVESTTYQDAMTTCYGTKGVG